MNFEQNTLYYGDCLEVMADWPDECIDLIYLDPPFNSNVAHNIIFGTGDGDKGGRMAQSVAFSDTWKWDRQARKRVDALKNAPAHEASRVIRGLEVILGESGMLAYVSYMAERLVVLKRLLSGTGSIYLHCDQTASHYLKVLMDAIFGITNFRNEIVWFYRRWSAESKSRFQRMHDTIFYYSKAGEVKFNVLYVPTSPTRAEMKRGYNTNTYRSGGKRLKQIIVEDEAAFRQAVKKGEIDPDQFERVVLRKDKGVRAFDVFEIPVLNPNSNERCGYPTQKPLALMKPIIEAGSDPGDLVLDPFCGCGTTVAAAHNLGRRWIGIDISPFAIDLVRWCRFPGMDIPVRGIPTDMDGAHKLAQEKPFDFEKWAISRIPGLAPNDRQVGDRGVDGQGRLIPEPQDGYDNLVLAQVKGGHYSLSQLRDFLHTLERENAAMGIFITLRALSGRQLRNASAELANAGQLTLGASVYPRAQLWSIEGFFAGTMPELPTMADPYTGRALPDELQTRFF